MVIICLRKISNINVRETIDPIMIDYKKNFVKKIFQFFDFYLLDRRIEKKVSIVKNIIVVLIFFDRFDRQFSRNSLKNYFSDEPKWLINYLLEILQTNTINNHFTDLTDYLYYKDCEIYWKPSKTHDFYRAQKSENFSNLNGNLNLTLNQTDIVDTNAENISNIMMNSPLMNIINNTIKSDLTTECLTNKIIPSMSSNLEYSKRNPIIERINNLIYEKYEHMASQELNPAPNSSNQINLTTNCYSYWSNYSNNLSIIKETPKESILDSYYDYKKIYDEFIGKIGEPKNYLSIYKHIIIKEVIVFIQISVLGYEKIPKINIPYSTLISHFYRVVENSNTSIDYEILIAFIRIIKKYGEQITDEWSDIFKILNIIIRREENKNYDKLIKVLYEILDRIKLLIISQKFNGVLSEYINFLDEFKTFPYDSLMILKCKYKLNSFLSYISKLESVIIENLIK